MTKDHKRNTKPLKKQGKEFMMKNTIP